MITVYHGTVSSWLPSIKKEGLSPVKDHGWHATAPHWSTAIDESESDWSFVFVTLFPKVAEAYAKAKAEYLRAPIGGSISNRLGAGTLTKLPGAPIVPDAEPVVLTLSLPNDWKVGPDPHSLRGIVSPKSIPPRYIKNVEVIHA